MALITKTYTFAAGTTIIAAEHNSNFDTIYNAFNGSISNVNIASNAAIADSKLAAITTATKVRGSAIYDLSALPTTAGTIPNANLNIGLSANQVMTISGTDNTLRAYDGSLLVNIQATAMTGSVSSASLGTGTPSASNYLRGDRTWASITNLVTQANSSNTVGTEFTSGDSINVVSQTKTVTSGNTILTIGTGYVSGTGAGSGAGATISFWLYANTAQVAVCTVNAVVNANQAWALSGITTGLSGNVTFSIMADSSETSCIACGKLSILEF